MREEEELSKTGVLKHVKDIIVKIRKVTEKLAKVILSILFFSASVFCQYVCTNQTDF